MIHPPSKNRGLWVISLSMSMVLNKKKSAIGSEKRVWVSYMFIITLYYKMRQILLQDPTTILLRIRKKFIAKCVRFIITKCDIYYKIQCFLQNSSVQSQ